MTTTRTLWRPVWAKELEQIEACGMRAFPPTEGSLFLCSEVIAIKIARDWHGAPMHPGRVTKFEIRTDYLVRYDALAGAEPLKSYLIPPEDFPAFNESIIGVIEVVHQFPRII